MESRKTIPEKQRSTLPFESLRKSPEGPKEHEKWMFIDYTRGHIHQSLESGGISGDLWRFHLVVSLKFISRK
jgi:hypothetical protein